MHGLASRFGTFFVTRRPSHATIAQHSQKPMAGSQSNSRKKVLIRRFAGDTLPGYLAPAGFVRDGSVDSARPQRAHRPLAAQRHQDRQLRRDFNLSDPVNPSASPAAPSSPVRAARVSGSASASAPATSSRARPHRLLLLDALVDDAGLFSPRPTPAPTPSASSSPLRHRRAPPARRHHRPLPPPAARQALQGEPPGELFHLPLDPPPAQLGKRHQSHHAADQALRPAAEILRSFRCRRISAR